MQFDLKCDCGKYMRLTTDTIQEAVRIIDNEGWTMAVDHRNYSQRISDHIKAVQNGSLAVIQALCNEHSDSITIKGLRISELIEALWVVKHTNGDLICMVQNGLDPSDFEVVSKLRVEMDMGFQVVKIDSL